MPEAEKVLPLAGFGRVEGGELYWELLVFLQNDADSVLEFLEIFLRSFLEW